MHIEIAARLRPFTHLPGSYLVLPGSLLRLQVFPTCVMVDDFSQSLAKITFGIEGPLDEFTILQDLEKMNVKVWGRNALGYFRYCLAASADRSGIELTIEKAPAKDLAIHCEGNWEKKSHSQQKVFFGPSQNTEKHVPRLVPFNLERLSLGSHKALDWELLRRRCCFKDIFPLWHRLGQFIPHSNVEKLTGTAALLKQCQEAIEANKPENILKSFRKLFFAGFEGMLSPRLIDADFNGIDIPQLDKNQPISPLVLLEKGGHLIRSLFFQEKPHHLSILPALPPEFHCGRILNISTEVGQLDLEWTKKSVRLISLKATKNVAITLVFSGGIKTCRLRSSHFDKGRCFRSEEPLSLEQGQNYWFDNFER